MKNLLFPSSLVLLTAAMLGTAGLAKADVANTWTAQGRSIETQITGGPWTLGQGPTTVTVPSVGYCVGGVPQKNPGTNLFQPYYFPMTVGQGLNLQGYFDYRPKDSNEAIVAAFSRDGGRSWKFQQEALELNPGLCPSSSAVTNAQTYPTSNNNDGLLSGNDAGQGHPFVMDLHGKRFLYTIDRVDNTEHHVDVLGLVVHQLQPRDHKPLNPTPRTFDVSTSTEPLSTPQPKRTNGLLNPDGIIADVPGTFPRVILYLQKQKDADTAFPAAQQCAKPPAGADQAGKKPNHDIVTPRLAQTKDGLNFTDLGPVNGLNDSTSVSWNGTRYVGPRGTLVQLPNHRWGLFFSGGNCLDADSDAFHYIGYAESKDLRNWTVINGLNNPIASIKQITVASNDSSNLGKPINIPANPPVIPTEDWFLERVYSPSATLLSRHQVSLVFAGYKVKGPSNDYSNYRTISQVNLKSSLELLNHPEEHEDHDR